MIYHVSGNKDHVSLVIAVNHNDIVFVFIDYIDN
jgi:hypothetical protein